MAKQERRFGPIDLFLIQHGQGEDEIQDVHGGWLDVSLTPLGVRQTEALADRLLRERAAFDALYASSLRRAVESAEILGQALGLTPVPHDGLRAFHRGDLTGLSYAEAEARFPGAWSRTPGTHERPVPNAETLAEFATRTWRALEEVVAEHPGRRVAVVTHGGVIRATVRRWLGQRAWTRDGIALVCEPASVTHLRAAPDGRRELVTFNDRAHLAALRE